MGISDFRFQISDCGFSNSKSQILNPKFRRRRAITLIEVLAAIFVMGVGMLAILTLFPLGALQMSKAIRDDRSASNVGVATSQFDTLGMRRPAVWVGWSELWDPTPPPPGFYPITSLSLPYGMAFCLDARGVAANVSANPSTSREMSTFPYQVAPYNPFAPGAPARMFRVSLDADPSSLINDNPINKLLADSLFTFDDDLAYDRLSTDPNNPTGARIDDKSRVTEQKWDTNPFDAALPEYSRRKTRRRIDAHLSWIATLVPKLERYEINSMNHTFVLSIVVFEQRPATLGRDPASPASLDLLQQERVLTVASMPGGGITGGEVLLRTRAAVNEDQAEMELDIHTNDWILLMGRNPVMPIGIDPNGNAVTSLPTPVFKWYRVSDMEAEVTQSSATTWERYCTLVGPDWDTTLTNIEAVAVEGVVAVVEKTVKLEL